MTTEPVNGTELHAEAEAEQVEQAQAIEQTEAEKSAQDQKDLVEQKAKTEQADETNAEATGIEYAPTPAPTDSLAASEPGLTVVDAPASAVAPGSDIVGTSQQPLPGEQPGVVAETPVAANTAADPHPEDHQPAPRDPDAVVPQTADDPVPETTTDGATKPLPPVVNTVSPPPAFEDEENDGPDPESSDALAVDGVDASMPPALRPTPAGPSSDHHRRVQRTREENSRNVRRDHDRA